MDIIFNTIKIKININNNEIFKTKWEHDKKKKGGRHWNPSLIHIKFITMNYMQAL